MNIELHLMDDGSDLGPLPSYETLSISPVFCDYGSIGFTYPKAGKRFSLLNGRDELEVVPFINGVARPEYGGIVQEIAGDDVAEAAVHSFTGLGYLTLLDEARVYPFNWPSFNAEDPSWHFVDATGGFAMLALIQAAQVRGSLVGITTSSFSNTTDSNGNAWTTQLTFEVKPGVTLATVLRNLVDQGMVEFQMVGRDLQMFNTGTLSTDRTVQDKPLIFRKGRDLSDSPRKTSTRDLATVMLAAGKEDAGAYHEVVDAPAVASRRRIEGYVSNGNITDPGTLSAFTESSLSRVVNPKMEKTHGLEFARKKSPQPIRDFNVGDWVFSDVGHGLERLRAKQWVLSVDASGKIHGSVTMNDMFAEAEERLAKRVEGIVGGSTISGESRAEPVVPEDTYDGIPPAAPTSLVVTSDSYLDDQGHTYAQVSASWASVAANADGTVMDDLAGYRVQWRYSTDGATTWRTVEAGAATSTSWSPLSPGVNAFARVVAYDKAGNVSAPSTQYPFTTAEDATPPEAPAAPTVDNYLGLLRIRNTGATASGAVRAGDERGREVHVSAVDDFAPDLSASSTTRVDFLSAPGYSFVKAAYGTTMYAKLVAVDHSGNYSAASAQGSASSSPVLSADIFAGAVGSLQLADLAVTSAKIDLLAVNSVHVGEIEAGKISAGILNAQVTVSGRIATALTGARREMNAIGFQAFNAAEQLTINFDGVNNLLTGRYRSALTGRRIEMGSVGLLGELNFYAPDGKQSFVRAYTESTGVEAIQIGVVIPGTNALWNRINYNSDEWANYRANRHEFFFGSTTGFFQVYTTDNKGASGTNYRVFYADSDEVVMHGVFTDRSQRFLNNGNIYFSYGDGNGDIQFLAKADGAASWLSPHISFFTGQGFGAVIRYNNAAPDRMELTNYGESGYTGWRATAFDVVSDRSEKDDIVDADDDFLAMVKGMRPRRYRRKGGDPDKPNPVEIGLIAQEAPPGVVVSADSAPLSIGLYQLAVAIAGAVQQLDTRLGYLEEGKIK